MTTVKELKESFLQKINKKNEEYFNISDNEILEALNEAQELFIKIVAIPRQATLLGIEKTQRNIEDIRPLLKNNKETNILIKDESNNFKNYADNKKVFEENQEYFLKINEKKVLNYWHILKMRADISKREDVSKVFSSTAEVKIRRYEDIIEEDPFEVSNFQWRKVNAIPVEEGFKFYGLKDFWIDSIDISYIEQPQILTLVDDNDNDIKMKLPKSTHNEIVDLAVLIKSGEILGDIRYKMQKLRMNSLS